VLDILEAEEVPADMDDEDMVCPVCGGPLECGYGNEYDCPDGHLENPISLEEIIKLKQEGKQYGGPNNEADKEGN